MKPKPKKRKFAKFDAVALARWKVLLGKRAMQQCTSSEDAEFERLQRCRRRSFTTPAMLHDRRLATRRHDRKINAILARLDVLGVKVAARRK